MDGEIRVGVGENSREEYEQLKRLARAQGVLVSFDDKVLTIRINGPLKLG